MGIVKYTEGCGKKLARIEELLGNHVVHRLDSIESEQNRQGALIDQLILNDGTIIEAVCSINKRLDKVKIPK